MSTRDGDHTTERERFEQSESGQFQERLRHIIGSSSARAFARTVGISDTVLRQYLAGRSEPTRPILVAIARVGAVRVEWLATGEGAMRSCKDSEPPRVGGPVPVEDLPKEDIKAWLDHWWGGADADDRAWLKVEVRRIFPEFAEWLKKRLERYSRPCGA